MCISVYSPTNPIDWECYSCGCINPPSKFVDDRCPECMEPYNWFMGYEIDDREVEKRIMKPKIGDVNETAQREDC